MVFIDFIGDIKKALDIQGDLGQKLEKANFEIDKRKWNAHLTLCRIKNDDQFQVPDFAAPKIDFTVDSIDLMKSKLTLSGAEYTVLESYKI
ncbi:hypothetical protein KKA15_05950 [Patescibacteria group bacterium]|nr:hypothetical protein [Patescibacteria group bacterium]